MSQSNAIVQEGFVLKKRRKKMQGFARRYFVLTQNGLLSYSFEPGQTPRDQISLHTAAISTVAGRKDIIHIDSGTSTFHLKCLSSQDFDTWMAALRSFVGPSSRRSGSVRHASTRRGSMQVSSKSTTLLDEMSFSLLELESAIMVLKQDRPRGEKETAHRFGLFKRASHHSSVEIFHEALPFQRIDDALTALKTQHAALSKSIQTWTQIDTTLPASLPIAEEDEGTQSADLSSSITRRSKHTSAATTISDLSEWFDASSALNEGAQEFVVESADAADASRILPADDSQSSLQIETSSIDTDFEVQTSETAPLTVVRRTQLPTPVISDEGNLFTLLKKNIGKDLSAITFPVTFNEPLTLLQRAAEELEYHDLLNQAATSTDPIERLSFVAAFAVSSYAHTRHRSGRKGFNPMLGETFEDVRMKFIAEKVRHNPVELAFHAEGERWKLWGTSTGRTKFWGKSLEIIPLGTTHLKIGNDRYSWKRPSSFVRNLMVGTKYLEHCGPMTINAANDMRCVLDFRQSSYWATSNVVSGTIHDNNSDVVSKLEGKWDDQFAQSFDSSHLRILWRVTPWSKSTNEYYGFTNFGITLNEITPDISDKLPPTDSRYRPDVRALEGGNLDLAEREKQRVEELQRNRKRDGAERQARWFKRDFHDEWSYVGGYWEARSKGWKGIEVIEPLW